MTGFQRWLALQVWRVRSCICWLAGHSIKTSAWKRSPYTIYSHVRLVRCSRCGEQERERGYFCALSNPEMFQ